MLLLTAISLFTSAHPYIMLLSCGLLMPCFTRRSLSEEQGGLRLLLQLLFSVIFIVFSGNGAAYLILYELRIGRAAQLFLPAGAYLALWLISGGSAIPALLLNMLILCALAFLLAFAERLAAGYLAAKGETERAMSVTAMGELYEKKLNQELVMKNYLADKNARLQERESISRNIHNSVGHSITAAIMTLDAADMLFETDPERAREKMNAANRRIHSSLDSIRQAVRVLDSESEFVSIYDFIGGLNELTDSFAMDTMLQIRTDFSDIPPDLLIPHEYGEFLNGAVRELLTNGVRHGSADSFTVRLAADSGHIRISVSDNGTSDFSPQNASVKIQNGYGLKKLISYAERCGGRAEFENENGFQSVITLPLYETAEG